MKRRNLTIVLLSILLTQVGVAQNNVYHSVLSQHTWHRLSVTQEGVYKLDYATLEVMGVDMNSLNPNQIRMFGNPSGALPEKNSEARPDDLTEMAIYVNGAEDGRFDAEDFVLFYGQEPTRWNLVGYRDFIYQRDRNYYSDTTFYYLCTDSGVDGLRIVEQATLPVEDATTVIVDFPDFQWHEEELFSPYSIGVNWYGEVLTAQEPELTLDFVFPNLVMNKPVRLKAVVLGRTKPDPMHYSMRVNDNLVVDQGTILSYGNNYYGKEDTTSRQITMESDTAHFILSLSLDSPKASLYLDYVEIYAWRQLKNVGDFFPFRLIPSQFGENKSAIWIQNVNDSQWLWEVSNPLVPAKQLGRQSAGNLVFATDQRTERRFVVFDPSAACQVASWRDLPNQDVHAISDAEMLIITAPVLMPYAQELADFHAEQDGMLSVVVDVNEIYNEFSTGTPDPSGIRDFIRMVYRRSAGNLKYVTLFGRASFDFRDLLGYGLNLVPCYEMKEKPFHEVSFCTDDFFGMMDYSEGQSSAGHIDLGIGRFPVSTPEEAEAMLRKLKHYCELSATHGEWMTNHLFVSDDDEKSYVTNNEGYERILDTLIPELNINKVYCGAYPKVSTTAGNRFPQATADIMRAFDDGVLTMSYSGHGGVVALADERVFGVSEIATMHNFDRLPFVFTATCEFTKFDNPLLRSAGEQMFLQPDGGAIAMLTTCRPTYGVHNVKLGNAYTQVVYRRDENGKSLRLGDIVRMAKSSQGNYSNTSPDGTSLNISFVLMGDPAMRLALPEEEVKLLKINGKTVDTEGIELQAMSMVSIEGELRTFNGQLDQRFNGEIWVCFFDQKTSFVLTYDTGTVDVKYHKNLLYKGKATVRDGKFSIAFQVPRDINSGFGKPRFSFYAYDSIRNVDAMGCFSDLTLGGTDPSMVADNEGPQINFYWNEPTFVNGDVVEPQGVLYADLYDAQGIYHYDFSIGRNIMLNSNAGIYNNLVVNDCYEPALDDFRRGRVVIPVNDLDPGTYTFTIKVWDLQDNPSEATLWLVVGKEPEAFLAQVGNFPNPFSEETWFTFSHFGEDGNFDVTIEVFDLLGRKLSVLSQKVGTNNHVSEPIRWDGRNSNGTPLPTGLYFYRFTITDEEGFSRSVNQRIMICR